MDGTSSGIAWDIKSAVNLFWFCVHLSWNLIPHRFISALEIPPCAPSTLISGGGDPEIYIWDFRAGRLLGRIPVWEHVRPFLKVKGGRKQWKDNGEGKRPPKAKKKKGKRAIKGDKPSAVGEAGDVPMETVAENASAVSEGPTTVYDEEVLVVSHIKYARLGNTDIVLFSAIG